MGNPSCERLGGEFLGCWKCWKCWECWKIYDFSTLSMFSMLSMLQKEGNAAQESPLYCERSSHQTQRRERTSSTRVKQHGRGDSTVQKSAQAPQDGKSDSSGKQERGRQALRSCDFGGHCFGSLLLSYHSALQGMR